MPFYHLNLRHRPGPRGLALDPDGDELADESLVRDHAMETARDLTKRARLEHIRNWYDCSFEVTDDAGRRVMTVPFSDLVVESDDL